MDNKNLVLKVITCNLKNISNEIKPKKVVLLTIDNYWEDLHKVRIHKFNKEKMKVFYSLSHECKKIK